MLLILKIDRKYWSFSDLVSPKLSWIDGLIRQRMRFTQNYRFFLLRSISFGMDLRSNYEEQTVHDSKFSSHRQNVADYSMLNFFAFTLYVPLWLTGPIVSFHDWMSQIKCNITGSNPFKSTDLSYRSIAVYIVRFVVVMAVNEWMLHYFYLFLMAKHDPFPLYLDECTSNLDYAFKLMAVAVYSFFCVFLLWSKFLLIWRFQRIIATLDGVVAPENMRRCVFHHTSITGFWKYWHSSFNLWNVRYIYIPMGGSKGHRILKFMNIAVVFVFTTLWHGDFELKLLIWGSLMALLIVPETVIRNYYYNTKREWIVRWRSDQRTNRYVHALGAVANIIMLFVANLIGFGPGYEMVAHFFGIVVSKWICVLTFMFIYFVVFCGALIMLHADYAQNVKGFGWNQMMGLKATDSKPHQK